MLFGAGCCAEVNTNLNCMTLPVMALSWKNTMANGIKSTIHTWYHLKYWIMHNIEYESKSVCGPLATELIWIPISNIVWMLRSLNTTGDIDSEWRCRIISDMPYLVTVLVQVMSLTAIQCHRPCHYLFYRHFQYNVSVGRATHMCIAEPVLFLSCRRALADPDEAIVASVQDEHILFKYNNIALFIMECGYLPLHHRTVLWNTFPKCCKICEILKNTFKSLHSIHSRYIQDTIILQ